MGQEEKRAWDAAKERARKAEYRERKRLEAELLDEQREQEIRDSFGYSASETRAKAERDEAARKMVAFGKASFPSLSSTQFPVRPGDLAPTEAQLKKLGGFWPGRAPRVP